MKTSTASLLGLAITLSLAAAAGGAFAQAPVTQQVGELIAKGRKTGEFGFALRMLQQGDAGAPASMRDALADSLVAVVIAAPVASGSDERLHSSIIDVLRASANRQAATPYRGAGTRLFRIAMEAKDMGDRGGAVFAISQLSDGRDALALLRRIATSENPVATNAIVMLWDMMRDRGGLTVLQELSRSGTVKDERARRELERVSKKYGWVK